MTRIRFRTKHSSLHGNSPLDDEYICGVLRFELPDIITRCTHDSIPVNLKNRPHI